MNEKKIYKSGKMAGVYRCAKRSEIMAKIPVLENLPEAPDVAGIIISGILNYGNDADMILMMAKSALNCDELDIKIKYDELNIARRKFMSDVIVGKLNGTITFPVSDLVSTFYTFTDMPTELTKKLQAEADVRDIKRYLACESRAPIVISNPFVNLDNASYICEADLLFADMEAVKTNKHKVGKKWIYDEEEVYVVEAVKLFPTKPSVRESSQAQDKGMSTRIEPYIMLKLAQKWCSEYNKAGKVLLKASYYYLQKDRENEDNYSDDFFGKGCNTPALTAWLSEMDEIDELFKPQIDEFMSGTSVEKGICEGCKSRIFCEQHKTQTPLEGKEIIKPLTLPKLSPAQEDAATTLRGNVRVIATAGSGKTTVMAYRILNLLKSGVEPEKIGCFTFTNAGADEMRTRIEGFCKAAELDVDIAGMTISTLHSFGDSLIKKYHHLLGYVKPPVLINDVQKTRLLEEILSNNPPIEALKNKYKNFYMDMYSAKGILPLMLDYFELIADSEERFKNESRFDEESANEVLKIYQQFEDLKHKACLIEHHDQEAGILKLLAVKPNLFDEVGIEHISVDEYQDTSNIQFKIINAMRKAKCVKSLFIVGDDDQSIYGFRDANVKLIKDFPEMIGESVKDVQLMENRRSTGNIVDFAAKVIGYNVDRIGKNPTSTNDDGQMVTVNVFDSAEDERTVIANSIIKLVSEEGVKSSDIAILTATNAELYDYAKKLEAIGIESVSINPEPVLENEKVKASISLVKFLKRHNAYDGLSYCNVKEGGTLLGADDDAIKVAVTSLADEVDTIADVTALFKKFDKLDENQEDEIFQAFLDDIKTAKEEAIATENLREVCDYILDFERFGANQAARREKKYNGVVLSTMHSSKGKEWPIVFVSTSKLEKKKMESADISERNRLLFVACTRAKERLIVAGTPNMFLEECVDALHQQMLNL